MTAESHDKDYSKNMTRYQWCLGLLRPVLSNRLSVFPSACPCYLLFLCLVLLIFKRKSMLAFMMTPWVFFYSNMDCHLTFLSVVRGYLPLQTEFFQVFGFFFTCTQKDNTFSQYLKHIFTIDSMCAMNYKAWTLIWTKSLYSLFFSTIRPTISLSSFITSITQHWRLLLLPGSSLFSVLCPLSLHSVQTAQW